MRRVVDIRREGSPPTAPLSEGAAPLHVGGKVLYLRRGPQSLEEEVAEQLVARFRPAGALRVMSFAITWVSMTLVGADPPPLLAAAVRAAYRRLRDAALLARLYESDPAQFEARDLEYRAAPSPEAVEALATRPTRCSACGDPFTERSPRCSACGRCRWCCDEEPAP